jgi:hypothetical protein
MEQFEEEEMKPTTIYFDSQKQWTQHFSMNWMKTDCQIADIMTNQTPGPRHTFLMELIHIKVKDQHRLIQEGC